MQKDLFGKPENKRPQSIRGVQLEMNLKELSGRLFSDFSNLTSKAKDLPVMRGK